MRRAHQRGQAHIDPHRPSHPASAPAISGIHGPRQPCTPGTSLSAGYPGASCPATWHMSGEPIDSCTLRANSHNRTRPASTPASSAIRVASAAGSAASRSSQFSMCCKTSGEVEARLAELTRTRDQLVILAARAAAQDPADCQGYCSIIAG